MKKFEGQLNGQVFDNQEEFIIALNKALLNGENISTSFQIEEGTPIEEQEKSRGPQPVKEYLPMYDQIIDKTYVDDILAMDDPDQGIENIVEGLVEMENSIEEAIPYNDSVQLGVYLNAVNDVIEILGEDLDQTDKALITLEKLQDDYELQMENLEKLMEENQEKIDTLLQAYQIIDNYDDFYCNIYDRVEREIENRKSSQEKPKCNCNCNCDGNCENCKCKKSDEPLAYEATALRNILKQLGIN